MKASEVIKRLQKLIEEYGDEDVVLVDFVLPSDGFLATESITVDKDKFGVVFLIE